MRKSYSIFGYFFFNLYDISLSQCVSENGNTSDIPTDENN